MGTREVFKVTSKLLAEMKSKFESPQAVLRALGLNENLLRDAIATDSSKGLTDMSNADLARKIHALANRQTTIGAMVTYLKPRLAMDAKISLAHAFDGVTGKNFKDKKPAIAADIKLQTKGKLAKDANLDDVEKVLDLLEKHEVDEGTDESVSEGQHKAMEAAANGNSNLGIPEKVGKEFVSKDAGNMENLKGFLKEKGMGEDDIAKACDMMMPENALDEDPDDDEAKKKKAAEAAAKDEADKDAEKKKAAEDKKAKDEEMKDMVKKPAMDAAIKAAVETTKVEVRAAERAIRKAEKDIQPYVGALDGMSFDSAEEVYRHALTLMNVPNAKTVPAGALETILGLCPKAGAQPVQRSNGADLGMDAAGKSFAERHPELAHIQTV